MTEEIKVGDRFLVEVEVVRIDPANTPGTISTYSCNIHKAGMTWPLPRAVLHACKRLPRQIKVGDRVTWGDKMFSYEVMHIHDGYAFMWNGLALDGGAPPKQPTAMQAVGVITLVNEGGSGEAG